MQQKKMVMAVSLALGWVQPNAYAQFDAVLNLSDLDGQNGFVINGVNSGDQSGISVSHAGDINGDGFDDVIIGAKYADPYGLFNAGSGYVVFGSGASFPSSFSLSTLDGNNGFSLSGVNGFAYTGTAVADAGDINGDGLDDLIIGAFNNYNLGHSFSGSSYVVFGTTSNFSSSVDLFTLNGSNGFALNGENENDQSGFSVSKAGDINGDGIGDLIIGASYADSNSHANAGKSYVVFGSDKGFPGAIELSNLDGSNGFIINGVNTDDNSGFSVSQAGDINADGFDDIIIGARHADPNGNSKAGSSYVLYGKSTSFTSPVNLSGINGLNGFVINGANANELSGTSVSRAGDINGDGIDDLIVGASHASSNGISRGGSAYVLFGSESRISNPFNLSNIDGLNGFVINAFISFEYTGVSVSYAGDINGDGIDDVIVGANGGTSPSAGNSYVIFGTVSGFPSPLNLSNVDGLNGFVIKGVSTNDHSGTSVSHAGDVNGEGIDDVIIGAYGASSNNTTYAGSSYVVFGDDGIFNNGFQSD